MVCNTQKLVLFQYFYADLEKSLMELLKKEGSELSWSVVAHLCWRLRCN